MYIKKAMQHKHAITNPTAVLNVVECYPQINRQPATHATIAFSHSDRYKGHLWDAVSAL